MRERLVAQYGLPAYDAGVLTQSAALARFFEQTAAAAANPKAASNWIMGELLRLLRASRRRRRRADHGDARRRSAR